MCDGGGVDIKHCAYTLPYGLAFIHTQLSNITIVEQIGKFLLSNWDI